MMRCLYCGKDMNKGSHNHYHIKDLPKRLDKNYWGMNYYAEKSLHLKDRLKKNDIDVNPELRGRNRRRTIVHEEVERYLISKRHESYNKADRTARLFEKNVR